MPKYCQVIFQTNTWLACSKILSADLSDKDMIADKYLIGDKYFIWDRFFIEEAEVLNDFSSCLLYSENSLEACTGGARCEALRSYILVESLTNEIVTVSAQRGNFIVMTGR